MKHNKKREIATLIPYRWVGNTLYFYLQRRDENAKRLPNWYGFFGGGIKKNEKPVSAMLREMKEELVFTPRQYSFFNTYEFLNFVNNVFVVKVSESFENDIDVREGKYGRFFSDKKIKTLNNLSDSDKLVITQVSKTLKKQFTF